MFSIKAKNLHWIDDIDNGEDLCLHGHAIAIIGSEVLEYENTTVSATALYLLKSITEDHIIYEDNQMLPCCGFFMIPDDDLQNVDIMGCPNGVDWTVKHDGEEVILITESGNETRISIGKYKKEVFRFADEIEDFYKKSLPRKKPSDWYDEDGNTAFWNEWNRRRNK